MKTIIITGSNRGIGLAFVKKYATPGHRVICTVRETSDRTKLEDLQKELAAVDVEIMVTVLDVGEEDSIKVQNLFHIFRLFPPM